MGYILLLFLLFYYLSLSNVEVDMCELRRGHYYFASAAVAAIPAI